MASQKNKYRVFLNFRGADVRNSLVDHLFQSLVAAGISTFLDSEKIRKGNKIESSLEEAIVDSEIYIPIFSTHYAESSWCLKELSLMWSHVSSSNSTHKMIPLFYQIEPWQVRHPDDERSPYANAFHKHSTKGRYTEHTINQWKNALREASSFSGWSLDTTSGYEGKLVKQVLMDVLNTLNSKSLHVAKRPVGLANRMDKLKDMLKIDPNDKSVRTVGIWGMGGIGKTTLSKAVFNDINSVFDASCFVSDVRENAKDSNKGLTKLQKQILDGLLEVELKVNSVHDGQAKMIEHLGSIRALLTLDDVDDRKQLEALHGDWFGGGSRVIITTRDKHILNLVQADEIYEIEELPHDQALELFSWHAFLRGCPDEGYEHLAERVVKACKGLPLSLEVMGAHLYDKKDNKAFWDEAVIRIESLMDNHLYETLKISFNGLHEEERQIFLDIACFFLGENKATAIGLWKTLGCKNPHTAIMNLSLKSLIRVELDYFTMQGHFTMHDHLRDLGREIMAEESREDPCKRSRLWHPDDVRRVLHESEEISNLRGFKCTHLRNVVQMESLALMENLQFLWLENVQLDGPGKTRFPPKLKWLRLWDCYKLWEFPTLPKGLVQANISGCSRLKRISFNMHELKVLNVSYCERLKRLRGLGSLKSLTELEVWSCRDLAELPNLPGGLVKARIVMCSRLKRISFNMSPMNELRVLNVSYCESLTEFPGLGSLKSLTELMLTDCGELAELPTLPAGLVQARIERCSRLKRIPFNMSQMNKLKVLNVYYCESLTELPGLGSLKSLKVLDLHHCGILSELSGLALLESLTDLDLQGCKNVRSLAGMEALKFLKRLIVSGLSVSQIHVQQRIIQGLSGLQVLCSSANRIPEWLNRTMQEMLKPEQRGLGEYCVLEDTKCTGIVFYVGLVAHNYGGKLMMNISTKYDKISREFTLPFLGSFDEDEYHVGILQEELPSIIKFRSGDFIRCSPSAGIVEVYLILDQNESGNTAISSELPEDVHYPTEIAVKRPHRTVGRDIVCVDFLWNALLMDDRPKRPRLTSLPNENGNDKWENARDLCMFQLGGFKRNGF
eukprot:Gb_16275 [translate_table: standard]